MPYWCNMRASTHPDIEQIGWAGVAELTGKLELPVYALDGVSVDDEGLLGLPVRRG